MTFKTNVQNQYKITAAKKHLYHITYFKHLSNIEQDGLIPGRGSSLGQGAGYQTHSTKRIFLTEKNGISFWYSKAEEWAEYNSDNPLEDELIPVVLRVTLNDDDTLIHTDQIGTRDASADAFYIEDDDIPHQDLEIWDGSNWKRHIEVDPKIAMEYESDDDDPDDGWWVFKTDNPLIPG